jgi:hypothetical protein
VSSELIEPEQEEEMVTAEVVAKTIGGLTTIGSARAALEKAGWNATIVAQRITVDQAITAQYVSCNGHAWWWIYAEDGTPPVWTVGAEGMVGNWIGAE